ncbi:leptin receptor overlapping transcript-like 1 isoform X1 [Fopius arisanus]|uniref:Leptin receptor overlapping transcript-like 1 isoform X1 n=2 Tax=Fopius arisanus TaxID=64838 RepID=A0A9R1SZF6_9HYME|nr:PREDICTED: leptin receptor overlapping transcript-like 1 isoform X1 [Fopius arisanus]
MIVDDSVHQVDCQTHLQWPGLKVIRLVTLAFAGSIGMTFVILGCALPTYASWWPLFVILFYVLAPIPTLIARRYTEDSGSNSNPCLELAIFITMGIVVSSFALPIVLARAPADEGTIKPGACYLTLAGNVVVYSTLVGFFMTFDQDDSDYSMW